MAELGELPEKGQSIDDKCAGMFGVGAGTEPYSEESIPEVEDVSPGVREGVGAQGQSCPPVLRDLKEDVSKIIRHLVEQNKDLMISVAKLKLKEVPPVGLIHKISQKTEHILRVIDCTHDSKNPHIYVVIGTPKDLSQQAKMATAEKFKAPESNPAAEPGGVGITVAAVVAPWRCFAMEEEELAAKINVMRQELVEEMKQKEDLQKIVDTIETDILNAETLLTPLQAEVDSTGKNLSIAQEKLLGLQDGVVQRRGELEQLLEKENLLLIRASNLTDVTNELDDLQLSMQRIGEENMSFLEKVEWMRDIYSQCEAMKLDITGLKEKVLEAANALKVCEEEGTKKQALINAAHEHCEKATEEKGRLEAKLQEKLDVTRKGIQRYEESVVRIRKEVDSKKERNFNLTIKRDDMKRLLGQLKESAVQVELRHKEEDMELTQVMKSFKEESFALEEMEKEKTELALLLVKTKVGLAPMRNQIKELEKEISKMKKALRDVDGHKAGLLSLLDVRQKSREEDDKINSLTLRYDQVKVEREMIKNKLEVAVEQLTQITKEAESNKLKATEVVNVIEDFNGRLNEHKKAAGNMKANFYEITRQTSVDQEEVRATVADIQVKEAELAVEVNANERWTCGLNEYMEKMTERTAEISQKLCYMDGFESEFAAIQGTIIDDLTDLSNYCTLEHEKRIKELDDCRDKENERADYVEFLRQTILDQQEKFLGRMTEYEEECRTLNEKISTQKKEVQLQDAAMTKDSEENEASSTQAQESSPTNPMSRHGKEEDAGPHTKKKR